MILKNKILFVLLVLIAVSITFASHGWDTRNIDIIGNIPMNSLDYAGKSGNNVFIIGDSDINVCDFDSHEDYIVFRDFYFIDLEYIQFLPHCGMIRNNIFSFYTFNDLSSLYMYSENRLSEFVFTSDDSFYAVAGQENYLYAVNEDSLYIFELYDNYAHQRNTIDISGDYLIYSDTLLFVYNSSTTMLSKFVVSDPFSPILTWQDYQPITKNCVLYDKLIWRDVSRRDRFYFTDVRSDSGFTILAGMNMPSSLGLYAFPNDSEFVSIENHYFLKYSVTSDYRPGDVDTLSRFEYNNMGMPDVDFISAFENSFYMYFNGDFTIIGINDTIVREFPIFYELGSANGNELVSSSGSRDSSSLQIATFDGDSTTVTSTNIIEASGHVLYTCDDTIVVKGSEDIYLYSRVLPDSLVLLDNFMGEYVYEIRKIDDLLIAKSTYGIKISDSWVSLWEELELLDSTLIQSIAFKDSIAYAIQHDSFEYIYIYDLTDSLSLEYVDRTRMVGRENDVLKTYGDYLYQYCNHCSDDSDFTRIFVYDITDPLIPELVDTLIFDYASELYEFIEWGYYSVGYYDMEITDAGFIIFTDRTGIRVYDISEYPVVEEAGYATMHKYYPFSSMIISDDFVYSYSDMGGFSAFDISYFTDPSSRESVTYESEVGWNLLSNPFEDYILSENLFTTPTETFEYDAPARTYNTQDTLANGAGFWAFSPEFPAGGVYGWELAENTLWDLYPGWNIIGASGHPIAVSDIDTSRIIMPIYGYDIIGRSYFEADTLYPTKGYWIMSPERQYLEIE